MADIGPVNDLLGAVAEAMKPAAPPPRKAAALRAPAARRMPQPGPDREIQIQLADGRRLRARIAPGVARRRDLAAVARATAENDRRAFGALRRQRAAIEDLRRTNDELTKKVAALEQRADLALAGLVQEFKLSRDQIGQMRELAFQSVKSQIQSASTVLNTLQATAYGDKGSVLSTNNLLLAGNQLFWNMLEPALRAAGVVNLSTATVIAAVAPLATLFTGGILLGDRQQERFLSGITTFTKTGTQRQFLRLPASLRGRTDIPVTVSALDPIDAPFSLTGRIVDSDLEIQLLIATPPPPVTGLIVPPPPPVSVRVAWTVDTGIVDG